MISRTHRFHGHGSLRYVYSNGKVVRGQYAVLKYAPNPRRKSWRVAIVVSRKVHKSAVTRNRIRRRIYEIVRLHIDENATACDLVFIVHSEAVAMVSATELEKAITTQIRKADIVEIRS